MNYVNKWSKKKIESGQEEQKFGQKSKFGLKNRKIEKKRNK